MTLTYAEFCAGYGGLGLAVEEVFDAELKWYSEFEAAPSKIMAHHWPGVPNHGDMTTIDFTQVERVDILSGGTPCQDLSHAGRRAGMRSGTRSGLWESMREAIATIKPTYVVWENVRGAYSAGADSAVEQCAGCMGDAGDSQPLLRALGRVLGDLSDLGYHCSWRGLRAADVGAPHGRFRVFILATYAGRGGGHEAVEHNGSSAQAGDRAGVSDQSDRDTLRAGPERGATTEDTDCPTCGKRWESASGQAEGGRARADTSGRSGAPTADAGCERGERRRGHGNLAGTPGASQENRSERERDGDATDDSGPVAADSGGGTGGTSSGLRTEPRETKGGRPSSLTGGRDLPPANWGPYAPAIRRWEAVRGTAPAPTELTPKGKHRLSAAFAEWMMGVPAGWVTGVDISRNEQLKAIGNGVVPQQAAAALTDMLNTPPTGGFST